MLSIAHAALVRIGGAVNARCVGSLGRSSPERTAAEIAADLTSATKDGARAVVLVGGEPTLRRDLRVILQMARRLGLDAGLATNGRMLFYPQMRKLLIDAPVAYVRVALHGAQAPVHDALVGVPGAFDQVWAGIQALLQEADGQMTVEAACTTTSRNAAQLSRLVQMLGDLPRRAAVAVRFVAPIDGLEPGEWAGSQEASQRVSEALKLAQSIGLSASWEGFPPCLLEGHGELRDEILRYGSPSYGPEEAGTAIPREGEGSRSHPFPCQECVHESTCPGAPRALIAREGEDALRPTRSVRANSFNFERVSDLPDLVIRSGPCLGKSLPVQGNPVRHLILHQEGKSALYRSDTGDFTDAEIRTTKDELEQVYLDLHDKGTLQEFLSAVRRVRSHAECKGCPDRALCCGAVVVDDEPAFEREERWIRKEISRLRGRVLDVGCGDQLYRDLIGNLIAEGHIEYHGVDPDGAALERMRSAGVGGTLHHSEIETFEFEPGYFDYILALRSLNHFRDMHKAFSVFARVMRVHGQFVLCDSVAYGLLRTHEQASYADAHAPVGHEHWRNWSSQQVVDFARRYPFRVDVHRPVSARSCNQWIVKLMRVPDEPPHGDAG